MQGLKDAPQAFMTWTEKMSVGVTVLDDDHKKLVDIINELHDGIMAGHKKEILGAVLQHLVEYTKEHFAREEELFTNAGFSGALMHKSEHHAMIAKISNVQTRYMSSSVIMLDLELMAFLQNWLVNHIQGSDKKYRSCLNGKGIL
jgi:hemerythrin